MGDTGPTGPAQGIDITGRDMTTTIFPTAATGIVEPPHIATLDELMTSHAAVLAKEAEDKQTFSILSTNSRDALRPSLFQWAAAGFPDGHIIYSINIVPPQICSDGVTRNVFDYFEYCLGISFSDVMTTIQSKVVGIQFSQSLLDTTLRLHVNKVVVNQT